MKRTILDRDGKPVEIEIDDPAPADTLEEMIQILTLAKHIRDNHKDSVYLPPYKPVKRKKKKVTI